MAISIEKYKDGKLGDFTSDKFHLAPTEKQKTANKSKLMREWLDMYDSSCDINPQRVNKLQENFELHAGRWKNIEKMSPNLTLKLGGQDITLGSGTLKHFPVIDRVSRSIATDYMLSPLILTIKDYSSRARNHRDRIRVQKVKDYFLNSVVNPNLERLRTEWDIEFGVIDPLELSDEQAQQRDADINRRLKEQTPEEIFHYLDKYNTPDEILANLLTNYTLRIQQSKRKFDVGGEYGVITGEEYHLVDIINKLPYHQVLNPKNVTGVYSQESTEIEDGICAKHVQYITPEEVIRKYGLDLGRTDLRKIAKSYSAMPGSYLDVTQADSNYKFHNGIESKVLDFVEKNPELRENMDVRSRDGQDKLKFIYQHLDSKKGHGFREAYITYRWARPVKLVERLLPSGQYDCVVRGEHYKKNTANGDLKVHYRMVDQVIRGVKLGVGNTEDTVMVNVGPAYGQYNSLNKPFSPKLTIYGGKDNTYMHNVENNSLIDLGKPWQYWFNLTIKKMEEHYATDIGNVFLGTTTMLPHKWDWRDWYQSLFVGRAAIVNHHKDGTNNNDLQYFRTLDMSRTRDMQSDRDNLEYFEGKIYSSMLYSREKIGQLSPYATNKNIQQSVGAVDRQLYRFFNRRRTVKENVLNALMHCSLIAYKNNEEVKSTVLDDFSRVYYEQNFNDLISSIFYLHVVDDFKENEKLESMRNLALSLVQTGFQNLRELSSIINAESMAELEDVAERIDRKFREAAQADAANAQELEKLRAKTQENLLRLKEEYETARSERTNEVKLAAAELNNDVLENAADVNRNKEADSIERLRLEIKHKEREGEKDRALDRYKFNKMPKKNKI